MFLCLSVKTKYTYIFGRAMESLRKMETRHEFFVYKSEK